MLATPPVGAFAVQLESPGLAGEFDGVVAVDAARPPTVRLQLFPDIGGKLLDLRADGREFAATFAGQPEWRCAVPIPDGTRPHLGLVFGLLLREAFTPVTAARVRGERLVEDGVELQLLPATGGSEATALLDDGGRIARVTVTCGWLAATIDADGRLGPAPLHGRLAWR